MLHALIQFFRNLIMSNPEEIPTTSGGESPAAQVGNNQSKILRNSQYVYSLRHENKRSTSGASVLKLNSQKSSAKRPKKKEQKNPIIPRIVIKRLNNRKGRRKKTSRKSKGTIKTVQGNVVNLLAPTTGISPASEEAPSSPKNSLGSNNQSMGTASNCIEPNQNNAMPCDRMVKKNPNDMEVDSPSNNNPSTPHASESPQINATPEAPGTNLNPAGRIAKLFSESVNLELKERFNPMQSEQNSASSSSSTRTFVFVETDMEDFSSSPCKEDNRSESEIQNFTYCSRSGTPKKNSPIQLNPEPNASKTNLDSKSSNFSSSCTNSHPMEFFPVTFVEPNSK
nr:PREDICTED: uncharacterized protein LOC109042334 isoform X1 [Bemisia tabaci]